MDPQHEIARLGNLLHIPPVSIEQIPGDGSLWGRELSDSANDFRPFLFDEGNLGIPQKVLYRVYMAAVPVFLRLRSQAQALTRAEPFGQASELLNASIVLLLANPGHQTALNARKWLVQAGMADVKHEMEVMAALLTVRDCSKQSILWHHRRWLLRRIFPIALSPTSPSSKPFSSHDDGDSLLYLAIPPDTFQHEFMITSRACETYYRNYYAWTHRYLCVDALAALARSSSPSREKYQILLLDEFLSIRQWTELHVSDYTAVQYVHSLYNIIRDAQQSLTLPTVDGVGSTLSRNGLVGWEHAKSLVESYPDHESLWLYLRASMTSPSDPTLLDDTMKENGLVTQGLFFARRFLLDDAPGRVSGGRALPLSPVNAYVVHRHACRFICWLIRRRGSVIPDSALVRRVIATDIEDHDLLDDLEISPRALLI